MRDFNRDGHTARAGGMRHHLSNVVVTTTDAASALTLDNALDELVHRRG